MFIKKIITIFKFNSTISLNFVNFQAYFVIIKFKIVINLIKKKAIKLVTIVGFEAIIKFKTNFVMPSSIIQYNFDYY